MNTITDWAANFYMLELVSGLPFNHSG
jgi:hypothetical protein